MTGWLLIGIAVLAFLFWNLYRQFSADRIAALCEKRRLSSRIVSRGQFFDGNRHLDVALALTRSSFFYENGDMQASIDLQWVNEIEYDTHLGTGAAAVGGKVLRLRCHSQSFEFVLPEDVVARWHMMLPPRRGVESVAPAIPELAPAATA